MEDGGHDFSRDGRRLGIIGLMRIPSKRQIGSANKRDRGDGGIPVLFHTWRLWPAAPHHERYAGYGCRSSPLVL